MRFRAECSLFNLSVEHLKLVVLQINSHFLIKGATMSRTAFRLFSFFGSLAIAFQLCAQEKPKQPDMMGGMPAADTSWVENKHLDIPYASVSKNQKLNVYLPNKGKGPFPVILVVHGGGWMMGDRTDMHIAPMLEGLKRGYAVVSTGYRLSGEAKFPAQIRDVKEAVRWIRLHAKEYNLDGSRIAAWGESAGGHLVALLGTSVTSLDASETVPSAKIQAVVAWFPAIELNEMDNQFKVSGVGQPNHSEPNSAESLLLGKPVQDALDLCRLANPETYISTDAPSFLIQHGEKDSTVPSQQSKNFAERLVKIIGKNKVTLDILPNAEHVDPAFERPENLTKVFAFLDKALN
jgi:acetyl esterase/lipase